jgi:cell division protein ZapB
MEHTLATEEPEDRLARLEREVARLIGLCKRLREENRSLRAQQEQLVGERARLIEHTELARARVEAMVSRLKAMEHGV